jgi:hypothetical protein
MHIDNLCMKMRVHCLLVLGKIFLAVSTPSASAERMNEISEHVFSS